MIILKHFFYKLSHKINEIENHICPDQRVSQVAEVLAEKLCRRVRLLKMSTANG